INAAGTVQDYQFTGSADAVNYAKNIDTEQISAANLAATVVNPGLGLAFSVDQLQGTLNGNNPPSNLELANTRFTGQTDAAVFGATIRNTQWQHNDSNSSLAFFDINANYNNRLWASLEKLAIDVNQDQSEMRVDSNNFFLNYDNAIIGSIAGLQAYYSPKTQNLSMQGASLSGSAWRFALGSLSITNNPEQAAELHARNFNFTYENTVALSMNNLAAAYDHAGQVFDISFASDYGLQGSITLPLSEALEINNAEAMQATLQKIDYSRAAIHLNDISQLGRSISFVDGGINSLFHNTANSLGNVPINLDSRDMDTIFNTDTGSFLSVYNAIAVVNRGTGGQIEARINNGFLFPYFNHLVDIREQQSDTSNPYSFHNSWLKAAANPQQGYYSLGIYTPDNPIGGLGLGITKESGRALFSFGGWNFTPETTISTHAQLFGFYVDAGISYGKHWLTDNPHIQSDTLLDLAKYYAGSERITEYLPDAAQTVMELPFMPLVSMGWANRYEWGWKNLYSTININSTPLANFAGGNSLSQMGNLALGALGSFRFSYNIGRDIPLDVENGWGFNAGVVVNSANLIFSLEKIRASLYAKINKLQFALDVTVPFQNKQVGFLNNNLTFSGKFSF
ncbi:hypothetical protein RDn1_084, partial [Candidatus Termititenax dinenymphae]